MAEQSPLSEFKKALVLVASSATVMACSPAEGILQVQVMVVDCYSASHDLKVTIDGNSLALDSPAERDDSVATCYSMPMEVGSPTEVHVQNGKRSRVLSIKATQNEKFLIVSAQEMTARFLATAPALD